MVLRFVVVMAYQGTRSRAHTDGWSGRALDDLAAALNGALAFDDADNDGSYAVVGSGSSGRRQTPMSVGESSSLGLPPRPARAGRALSGGGGGAMAIAGQVRARA